jgi:predicted ArsR family transcriptional regulator
MNNSEDFGYFSKTAAEQLGVSTDTLRSWFLKLEAVGVEEAETQPKMS